MESKLCRLAEVSNPVPEHVDSHIMKRGAPSKHSQTHAQTNLWNARLAHPPGWTTPHQQTPQFCLKLKLEKREYVNQPMCMPIRCLMRASNYETHLKFTPCLPSIQGPVCRAKISRESEGCNAADRTNKATLAT